MTELEILIIDRAAAMAALDGVGVQIVHVFGATSQINAELATARDRLISHPGLIAEVLDAKLAAAVPAVSPELAELVIAARIVAYEDQSAEALEKLDKASEAFAELVPWDDAPQAEEPAADATDDTGTSSAAAGEETGAAQGEPGAPELPAADGAAAAQDEKPADDAATATAKATAATGRAKPKAK